MKYTYRILILFLYLHSYADEIEYWNEEASDLDNDFPDLQQPSNASASDEDGTLLDAEQSAITWWFVVFVCVFQTLHSVPQRAIQWLLGFLYGLLLVLGQYSQKKRSYCSIVSRNNFQEK